jgi:hypothetical protein
MGHSKMVIWLLGYIGTAYYQHVLLETVTPFSALSGECLVTFADAKLKDANGQNL